MADELDDEERELLKKHREQRAAAKAKEDAGKRVVIWHPDGSGAEVSFADGARWLKDKFGIGMDEVPENDEEAGQDEQPADKQRPLHFRGRSAG